MTRRHSFQFVAIVLLTLAANAAHAASERVALVIGNGAYQNTTKLINPGNDATDVAQALRGIGFEVIEGRDLDKRGMEARIVEFGGKLDRARVALFFYAGHGIQVGGRNYLIPTDAKLERAGNLNFETIDVASVLAQMEAEKRVNLVFLDACRDNPLARSFATSLGANRSAAVGRGLASIQGAVGTMIAYATQPDNVALDGAGRNSPFTTALLKHVATPGLEIRSMMTRVRADVLALTADKQLPWDHSSLIGEVVLVPGKPGAPEQPKVAVATPQPLPPPQPKRIVIDFDALDAFGKNSGIGDRQLADYLARFGVKLTSNTAQRIAVFDERNVYEGKAVKASSGRGVLMQQGGNPVSYTLEFNTPLKSIGFNRVALVAGPSGITHPVWKALAQDANGRTLGEAGENTIASSGNVPAKAFTLNGPGIKRLTVTSDHRGFAAFSSLVLDNLVLVTD
ncbi:MAG: caspase domain-containing protein [Pseudorhodoplanes sp.]